MIISAALTLIARQPRALFIFLLNFGRPLRTWWSCPFCHVLRVADLLVLVAHHFRNELCLIGIREPPVKPGPGVHERGAWFHYALSRLQPFFAIHFEYFIFVTQTNCLLWQANPKSTLHETNNLFHSWYNLKIEGSAAFGNEKSDPSVSVSKITLVISLISKERNRRPVRKISIPPIGNRNKSTCWPASNP